MTRRLPIDKRLDRAAQLVTRSRCFYDIWRYLKDRETLRVAIDTMQRFSEFFRFAPEAHFVAFIVQIDALFETSEKTINLPGLARELKTKKLLSTKDVADVDALLREAQPLATKVAILRNHLFAHRSATVSYSAAFRLAKVTADQLCTLTEIALKIANRLLAARGHGPKCFNRYSRIHTEEMLKVLMNINPD
jgi:hypothetical protein